MYSAHDSKVQRKVVIKFVEHYCEDGHRLWADAGPAVELLDIRPLAADFSVLILPFLEQSDGWVNCCELPRDQRSGAKDLVFKGLCATRALRDGNGRYTIY